MNEKVELSNEQTKVLYKIVKGIQDRGQKEVKMGGFGGTGKTVLARYLSKFFPDFAVCAFTGKAASVLRKRGIEDAATIHSLIYVPEIENGQLVGFDLCPKWEMKYKGFIVDEASMVSKDIYADLCSYDLPMIFIGDHGQLEPIGTDFNLMADPEYRLETIHRNANEIAHFAQHLRLGRNSYSYRGPGDRVSFTKKKDITDDDLIAADQIIVAFNASRVEINKQVRSILGYPADQLHVGDRVICLKNMKEPYQLYNGMQGTVTKLYQDSAGRNFMDFKFDDTTFYGVRYDKRFFNVEKPEFDYSSRNHPVPFDYAYAITAHKSQGSEYDNGLVYEQICKNWEHKRWAYTAASRFKNQLKWAY